LQYQSFCESFLSKNLNQNAKRQTMSSKGKNIHRNVNKINTLNINITGEKRERSGSKSKNQLEDYNIDKLKEIGDCFALRHMNKDMQKKYRTNNSIDFNNNKNKINDNFPNNYINNNNKNPKNNNFDKNDIRNGIINNFINIEKKRKESKSKIRLQNKTEEKKYNNCNIQNINKETNDNKKRNTDLVEKNKKSENKNHILYDSNQTNSIFYKYSISTNKSNYTNYSNSTSITNGNNRTKLLKVNRNEALLKNHLIPNLKKIKGNNIIKRKKYIFTNQSPVGPEIEGNLNINNNNTYILNEHKRKEKDKENYDGYKTSLNIIQSQINQKTFINNKIMRNYNTNNNNNDLS
jgi:hypothetical protein